MTSLASSVAIMLCESITRINDAKIQMKEEDEKLSRMMYNEQHTKIKKVKKKGCKYEEKANIFTYDFILYYIDWIWL